MKLNLMPIRSRWVQVEKWRCDGNQTCPEVRSASFLLVHPKIHETVALACMVLGWRVLSP